MKRGVIFLLYVFLCTANYIFSQSYETFRWNRGRGYEPFSHAQENGLILDNQSWLRMEDCFNFPHPANEISLTFRAHNLHSNSNKRYPYVDKDGFIKKNKNTLWGFFIYNESKDSIFIEIGKTEKDALIESKAAALITVVKENYGDTIHIAALTGEHIQEGEKSQWQMQIKNGVISLSAGSRQQYSLGKIFELEPPYTGFGFYSGPGSLLEITDISLILNDLPQSLQEEIDPSSLSEYFINSDDRLEGFWKMFDRELDEDLLKPGGDYLLAIIKEDERYKAVYIDGAKTNSKNWKAGMTKAYIYPTLFKGIYEVEWIDAEGNILGNDIKAQTGEAETLRFQFPYHSSSFRLRKVDLKSLDF